MEMESNTVWSTIATLANCDTPLQLIIFPNSVSTKGLRIRVTLTEKASAGLYSRTNEIIPVIATNRSGTSTSLGTLQPSSVAKWDTPSGTTTSFDVFQPNSSAEPIVSAQHRSHSRRRSWLGSSAGSWGFRFLYLR